MAKYRTVNKRVRICGSHSSCGKFSVHNLLTSLNVTIVLSSIDIHRQYVTLLQYSVIIMLADHTKSI